MISKLIFAKSSIDFLLYLSGLSLGYVIGKNTTKYEPITRIGIEKRKLLIEKNKTNSYDKFIKSKELSEEYRLFCKKNTLNNENNENNENNINNINK